ncbi:MAG TPA: hypothetical protein PKY30_23615, partial [Myxococcota bacterium]|nr:hypothetical protein [Myxococcota bacterium]
MSLDIASKFRRAISAVGMQIKGSADELDTASPTITSGSGAPSESEPNGSLYLRTGGASGTALYRRIGGAWVAEGSVLSDERVAATLAIANATGGATGAALTLTLKQSNNSTAITSARQVTIFGSDSQYPPFPNPTAINSVTFENATVGSIIASGNGWALVETTAAGAFACTCTNTDDETLYFQVCNAASSDATKSCVVQYCNSDAVTW